MDHAKKKIRVVYRYLEYESFIRPGSDAHHFHSHSFDQTLVIWPRLSSKKPVQYGSAV